MLLVVLQPTPVTMVTLSMEQTPADVSKMDSGHFNRQLVHVSLRYSPVITVTTLPLSLSLALSLSVVDCGQTNFKFKPTQPP